MSRSATIVARLSGEAYGLRLAYSTNSDLSSPSYTRKINTVRSTARFRLEGLTAGTTYYYALEANGSIIGSHIGSFKALPEGATSFMCAFASCSTSGSTDAVFSYIQNTVAPDFFIHMGDFHYDNIATNDPDLYDAAYDTQLAVAVQRALYENVALFPMIDDHDYGGPATETDKGATAHFRRAATSTFRRRMPTPTLVEDGPYGSLYYSFVIGRVRFIMLDCMTARSPADATDDSSKSMLGSTQKAWLFAEMLAAETAGQGICIVSPKPWIGDTGGDGWGEYSTERAEISQFISDEGLGGRVMMLNGDMHGLAIDSGANSDYSDDEGAAIPVFVAAPLDRSASSKGGPWDIGSVTDVVRGQFGQMIVTDTGGATIGIVWNARNKDGETPITHSFDLTL